jgi:hypothetical protein
MQEETIEHIFADVLHDEVDEQAELEQVDEAKQEEPKPSGYMTIEAWEASGKDPKEWVSEDVFKERTQRIKETSRLKRELADREKDFDNRLKNVNLLAQAQLARQREELISRRDDAIDIADKATVKRLDKQIDDLDKEAELVEDKPAVQQVKPKEVVEWEEENTWIEDVTDPRTPIAQKAYIEAIQAGKTIAGALRAADKAITAIKQESKHDEIRKKPAVSMSDSPRSASVSRNDSPSITWSQLSGEEKTMFHEFFERSGMTQKDYLKTVADQRKGV